MKKVLFWICCLVVSFGFFYEYSFAATASFVTKDGRMFCETDTLNGMYSLCTASQVSGTGLLIAERYGPRLVETPTEKICVEDGKEVAVASCQSDTATLTVVPLATSGSVETASSSTATSAIEKSVVIADSVPPVHQASTETPVWPPVWQVTPATPIDEGVAIDNGIMHSLNALYTSCIQSTSTITCSAALGNIGAAIVEKGTFFILCLSIIFVVCFVFWCNMLMHAVKNPIPGKIIWIVVILMLSLLGAILYYFFGKRPYVAMIIASLPPAPPSFFN